MEGRLVPRAERAPGARLVTRVARLVTQVATPAERAERATFANSSAATTP